MSFDFSDKTLYILMDHLAVHVQQTARFFGRSAQSHELYKAIMQAILLKQMHINPNLMYALKNMVSDPNFQANYRLNIISNVLRDPAQKVFEYEEILGILNSFVKT